MTESELLSKISDKLDRLTNEVADLKTQMVQENGDLKSKINGMDLKLDNDYKILNGNGHPGLLSRVTELEKWVGVHEQTNKEMPNRVSDLEKKMLVQEKLSQSKTRMIERWLTWVFAIANIIVIAWKC